MYLNCLTIIQITNSKNKIYSKKRMHCFIRLRDKLFLDCRITCKFDTGIFRYMREEGISDMNFLDRKDVRFQDLRESSGCAYKGTCISRNLSSKQIRELQNKSVRWQNLFWIFGSTSKKFAGGLHQRNILAKSICHFSESGMECGIGFFSADDHWRICPWMIRYRFKI